jgi:hypothetical protein
MSGLAQHDRVALVLAGNQTLIEDPLNSSVDGIEFKKKPK